MILRKVMNFLDTMAKKETSLVLSLMIPNFLHT